MAQRRRRAKKRNADTKKNRENPPSVQEFYSASSLNCLCVCWVLCARRNMLNFNVRVCVYFPRLVVDCIVLMAKFTSGCFRSFLKPRRDLITLQKNPP